MAEKRKLEYKTKNGVTCMRYEGDSGWQILKGV
jgi:hypothetical protein